MARQNRPGKTFSKWFDKNFFHFWVIGMLVQLTNKIVLQPFPISTTLSWVLAIYNLFLLIFILFINNPLFKFVRRKPGHKEKSPLSGKLVKIKDDVPTLGGYQIVVLDWVDRMNKGKSWLDHKHDHLDSPVMMYAIRRGQFQSDLDPKVNEVLMGKIKIDAGNGLFGLVDMIVHIDELDLSEITEPLVVLSTHVST